MTVTAKPFGPIPPEFSGLRQLPWQDVQTPAYVYDFAVIEARIARLRAALPERVGLHYAIKANPFAPLLQRIAPLVDGMDVASAGEMARALDVMAAGEISFAGPGKRDAELEAAIRAGVTLNLESIAEGQRALAIGKRLDLTPRLAVRVNPDFELRGSGMKMGGRASPFGIETAQVPELVAMIRGEGGAWRGLHIFAGSQSLDTAAIIATQAATVELAARLADAVGTVPPLVNLGGGFGIPYFPGDTPVAIEAIGAALESAVTGLDTDYAIELGRWLVGEAGVYLARVVDRKESQGETFLIVEGGLNHHLAATGNFGTVVRRNYPVAVAHRMQDEAEEVVTVVGPLCTPLDRLADRVALPRAEVGDMIAIFASGAYGATASPSAFLGHPAVAELVV
jgi:diaminopimelate decarboxylase